MPLPPLIGLLGTAEGKASAVWPHRERFRSGWIAASVVAVSVYSYHEIGVFV